MRYASEQSAKGGSTNDRDQQIVRMPFPLFSFEMGEWPPIMVIGSSFPLDPEMTSR